MIKIFSRMALEFEIEPTNNIMEYEWEMKGTFP